MMTRSGKSILDKDYQQYLSGLNGLRKNADGRQKLLNWLSKIKEYGDAHHPAIRIC